MSAATRPGELLPWAAILRLGLHVLGIPPAQFWGMTPRELAAAAGLSAPPRGIGRDGLAALMARYPDH